MVIDPVSPLPAARGGALPGEPAWLASPSNEALSRISRLVARALGVPAAAVLLQEAAGLAVASTAGIPGDLPTGLLTALGSLADGGDRPLRIDDLAAAGISPASAGGTGDPRACLALPLLGDGGRPLGILAVCDVAPRAWSDEEVEVLRDVSAVVLRELRSWPEQPDSAATADALRQNEERFRLMVEGSEQVFFYIHDVDGHFEYVSPSVRNVLGYAPEELLARPYRMLLTGDDSDVHVAESTAKTLEGEAGPSTYAAVTRHKDGRTVLIEVVESSIRRGGRIVGVQGFARDITERRRAETELRIRTAHLEQLIESAPEAIVVLDNTQRVMRVNREFSRMFGYAPEEAIGRQVDDLIVPGDRHDESDLYGKRVSGGETIGVRAVRTRSDGRPIHVSILATPIVVDGSPTAIYGIYRDISEQVRAEEAVRRSEEHFRSLIEYSTDVIDIVDAEGIIRFASPSSTRVLGYPPEEMVGRHFFDFVHPEDRGIAARAFAQGVQTPFSADLVEVRILHRDGGWRMFEAAARNLLDHPAVQGVVITSRDVTARKQAEAALRRNAAILGSIRDSVVVTDLEGVITYWNEGAARLFGWAAEEILGLPLRSRLPAEMHTRLDDEARRLLAGEEIHGEYEDARKDGSRILTDTRISLIRDGAGAPAAILRIARDITEQRLLGRVLEEMPDAVICLDAEHRIVSCNAAAERTLGYSADELHGQHVSMLAVDSEQRTTATVAEVLTATLRDSGWTGEVLQRRKDGFHFPARLTTATVRDSQGKVIGQAGLLHDLTEEKLREGHLRRAERLASVGTMLSGIAHELNNPLTSIKSFSQLMLFDDRGEEDREALQVIHREADRAAKIVADLRVIARQTLEVEASRREAVDLNELVRHILRLRRTELEGSHLEIREDLTADLVPVWGERSRLEQMIHQLVLNGEQAIESDAATRRLIIRTRPSRKGVTLSVIDSGAGIPPANLDRIFDPFWTTREPGEGMGLGLSLVHSIVTEHGGEIRVESELGKGSAFTVELPWSNEAVSPPSRTESSAPGPSLRVLLVEDEAPISLSLARFLERRGHAVDVADNGAIAIRSVDSGSGYDVIVSDLCMPGLDGDALFAHLAARGDGTERKMIIVTGDPKRADSADFLTAGVPVISKPFVLSEIAELIERRASHASGEATPDVG